MDWNHLAQDSEQVTGPCGHCKGTFGLHKIPIISWLDQDLSYSKRTLLQGLNFSLVSVLLIYGYCGNASLLHFHASKGINYSHNPVIFLVQPRLMCLTREEQKQSRLGAQLCVRPAKHITKIVSDYRGAVRFVMQHSVIC